MFLALLYSQTQALARIVYIPYRLGFSPQPQKNILVLHSSINPAPPKYLIYTSPTVIFALIAYRHQMFMGIIMRRSKGSCKYKYNEQVIGSVSQPRRIVFEDRIHWSPCIPSPPSLTYFSQPRTPKIDIYFPCAQSPRRAKNDIPARWYNVCTVHRMWPYVISILNKLHIHRLYL